MKKLIIFLYIIAFLHISNNIYSINYLQQPQKKKTQKTENQQYKIIIVKTHVGAYQYTHPNLIGMT
ncbi:MAG: hypothetical protein A2X02_02230 [Bacteroidetes bacterium GWF2_29_10]|nr:MAG: hypothetical protein A2X02_02230 [Bacteroidetes bacterium GWF2_29_10]